MIKLKKRNVLKYDYIGKTKIKTKNSRYSFVFNSSYLLNENGDCFPVLSVIYLFGFLLNIL